MVSQYQGTHLGENEVGRNKAAALGRGSSPSPFLWAMPPPFFTSFGVWLTANGPGSLPELGCCCFLRTGFLNWFLTEQNRWGTPDSSLKLEGFHGCGKQQFMDRRGWSAKCWELHFVLKFSQNNLITGYVD